MTSRWTLTPQLRAVALAERPSACKLPVRTLATRRSMIERRRTRDQTAATVYDRSAYNRGTHRVAWRLGYAAGRRWLLWRERLNCLTRLHVLKSGAYNRREGRTTADQSIKRGRCGERFSGRRSPAQIRNALRYQRKSLLTSYLPSRIGIWLWPFSIAPARSA
jgi:hypothetical protein